MLQEADHLFLQHGVRVNKQNWNKNTSQCDQSVHYWCYSVQYLSNNRMDHSEAEYKDLLPQEKKPLRVLYHLASTYWWFETTQTKETIRASQVNYIIGAGPLQDLMDVSENWVSRNKGR